MTDSAHHPELDDLLQPDALRDPYPWYARLRSSDPVHWNPRWRGWVVSSYEACAAVIRDVEAFSSERLENRLQTSDKGTELVARYPNVRYISTWMSFVDPPQHSRLRQLVNKAFTPRAAAGLAELMEQVAEDLMARLPLGEEIDFIEEFCYPFPLRVITGLLGVPSSDAAEFKKWSDDLLPIVLGGSGVGDRYERADRGLGAMADYLRDAIASRRQSPRDDLITALVEAREVDDLLTDDEIIGTCMILLFGGHETSSNLVAHALLALSEHPSEFERLRADPDILSTGVDEFLRYDGPSKGFIRWARHDREVGGQTISAGDRVLVLIAAANRDPAHYVDPDKLDLSRAAKDHLGFGWGIHHCLGAPLARAEAQVALRQISQRFSQFHVRRDALTWQPTMLSRSLLDFPVTFAGS